VARASADCTSLPAIASEFAGKRRRQRSIWCGAISSAVANRPDPAARPGGPAARLENRAARLEVIRLFVAVDIPDAVRQALSAWIASLQSAYPRSRWARANSLHVTLKFIGERPEELLDAVRVALRAVRQQAPIAIDFRGAGFFPNERRPRVLWAGIEAGPEFARLAEAIDLALAPVGIPRETRDFRPHLTVARFPESADRTGLAKLRDALASSASPEFGSARVADFHLFRSELKPSGAEYARLDSFDFTAKE
jgi:2'-5' RNA ligase